jgi:hypothetical protein
MDVSVPYRGPRAVEQLVSHLRTPLALFLAALAGATTAAAGPGVVKGKKTDPARVPALVQTLKADADEKRRKAAADELARADARSAPEVVAALAAALQKDAAAAVRAGAAEALGQLGVVDPFAGVALEVAAGGDPSPAVRLVAKRTLWEYYLNGYHSPKGADGAAAQTVEPPLASPAGPQPAAAAVLVPSPPVAPPAPQLPPPPLAHLPPVAPPQGPRLRPMAALGETLFGPRPAAAPVAFVPPLPNVTSEPPIARRPERTSQSVSVRATPDPVPPPEMAIESLSLPPPVPTYVPTLPPFYPDLPSVVLAPDETRPVPRAPAPVAKPKIPATLPLRATFPSRTPPPSQQTPAAQP